MKRDQDTLLLSSESTHVLVIETITGITSWVVSSFPVGELRHAGLLTLTDDTEQSLENRLRQKKKIVSLKGEGLRMSQDETN